MNDVIRVSSTEEYFAGDREQVYCKHGTYIGYPGGADYMCGACENGLNTLCTGLQIDLEIRFRFSNESGWSEWVRIDRVYSLAGIRKFDAMLDVVARSPAKTETQIILGTYQYWGTADDSTE